MIRSITLFLAAGLAGAAALPFVSEENYEALQALPLAETAKKVRESPVKLSDAIAWAEEATDGLAREARLLPDEGVALVSISSESAAWRVRVGKDGAILDKAKEPEFLLPGEPVSGEWTVLPSGLKYFEIVEGKGETPPSSSSKVKVHYTGWLVNGRKFDSSVDRGQPATFPLNGVIKGWTEGVGSMKVGGKRKLVIPYNLAYGEAGRPPIPPKAALIFDVELIEIVAQ